METKAPVLRSQTSLDIYNEALALARVYCPELKIPENSSNYFDSEDPALVIFKLFSELTELLLSQTNKIPDKYQLAFLDFIGVELLPPGPAKSPLTFSLSEGSSGAYVPAGTSVASSNDSSIVFETSQDLSVVAMGLDSVFSINPWEDRYTEHQEALLGEEDGFSIFGGDSSEIKLDHILYLGDDNLLDIRKEAAVDVSFKGENLSEKYFNRWFDGNNNPLKINEILRGKSNEINVSLSVPKMEKTLVDGISSFWLAVSPEDMVQIVSRSIIPEISEITASIKVDGIIPDAAVFNNAPLDFKKGFFPFGEEPKIWDTFYIGSEEAFSKTGAKISLNINAVEKPKKTVSLVWEYWNGSAWISLEVEDYTSNLLSSGVITFECPLIPITEINGQPSRWIRIRLDSGDFGTAGGIKQQDTSAIVEKLVSTVIETERSKFKDQLAASLKVTDITFGFEYKEGNFNPPFIESITISCSYSGVALYKKIAFNNFEFKDFKAGNAYIPYEETPAFYLGFKENITDAPLTLFFAVKERLYNEKHDEKFLENLNSSLPNEETEAISLTWECTGADDKWIAFRVEDETEAFRTEGIVSFLVPPGIQKRVKFGKELYWIRAKVNNSRRVSCPKLKGIFPNTVWALNTVTVENEVLGSGNGEPGLSLFFSKQPILEGQIIEIKEPTIPSADELKAIEVEGGSDALRIVKEDGEVKEVWVKWKKIGDFSLSSSFSRHYMLDRESGKITFGNGVNGMIPPRGENNIVARWYQSGGGEKGDVPAGTLTSLKTTIPYIESVTNHVSASGGMDLENLESAINRGPSTLKNGGRAVTREDFEWLSFEASQYVARAKCIVENGDIKVLIAPNLEGNAPIPEAGFLDLIERYLKERALITLSEKISVLGPAYEEIEVEVKFKPTYLSQSKVVAGKIEERVKQFLHPLKGGQNGEGWDFGQDIFISEITVEVENIEGVDYVTEINLRKGNENISGIGRMQIESNSLPFAGSVIVTSVEE